MKIRVFYFKSDNTINRQSSLLQLITFIQLNTRLSTRQDLKIFLKQYHFGMCRENLSSWLLSALQVLNWAHPSNEIALGLRVRKEKQVSLVKMVLSTDNV